jgi:RNA polymerase sigma-70 factor (ECF subfamily)
MEAVAEIAPPIFAPPQPGVWRPQLERRGKGLDATDRKEDEWAGCLAQIRDEQDAQAFARLFGHFAPRVKAYLMKTGASEGLAEETMQEAMAIVWRKAGMFDPSRASAATWIFTIARNKRLDAVRKMNRPEPEDLPWGQDDPEDPAETVATSQEEQKLREAVAKLPERQRGVIEQAYFGELSHREISDLTGLPLGTIKSRIRLGLERLRHEMSMSR